MRACQLAVALRPNERLGQVRRGSADKGLQLDVRLVWCQGLESEPMCAPRTKFILLYGRTIIGTQSSHSSASTTVIPRDSLVALGVSDPVPH